MRAAVVGHVEWVQFARLARLPRQGEIVHASDSWEEAAGGGAVAAVQLAKLAGEAAFFTALGDDELAARSRAQLERQRVTVWAAQRARTQRRGLTFVDDDGERTIVVIGERIVPGGGDPLPWERLSGVDAVYFTGGDPDALAAARKARVLVATPRAADTLVRARVRLDALVLSDSDEFERTLAERLDPPPDLAVYTGGARGGRFVGADGSTGSYAAAPLPAPLVDAYGAGDSFAAGFAYGLGDGRGVQRALELAARCGAACMTGRGPYEAQLSGPA